MYTHQEPVVPCLDATTKQNRAYSLSCDSSLLTDSDVRTRHQPLFFAAALVLAIGSLCSWPLAGEAIAAIPALAQWEAQMLTYGQMHCTTLQTGQDQYGNIQNGDQLLAATYYDAIAVYLQIYQRTGDAKWWSCAQAAKVHYRDNYVLRYNVNGEVPGYWNFTNGLVMDYQINGDETSKFAATLLSQNAAYSPDFVPLEWSASPALSREVAYAIRSYLNTEKMGLPRRARLAELVNQAFSHIDQWFISKSYRAPDDTEPSNLRGQYYIQPFMVGLTLDSLIMYYDATSDPQERARVVSNVQISLDWLWANSWVAADGAFWYENDVPDASVPFFQQRGAPDLNLLIAPAYAWLYKITGNATYRDRGDQIFAGGVQGAYLYGIKQFNQSYIRSFDYVKWRQQAEAANGAPRVPSIIRRP
jgi:hypothetical protein